MIQFIRHLNQTDFLTRSEFYKWFLIKSQKDDNFTGHIIWSDETKFGKNGLFNTHNSHFWSDHNTHAVRNYKINK